MFGAQPTQLQQQMDNSNRPPPQGQPYVQGQVVEYESSEEDAGMCGMAGDASEEEDPYGGNIYGKKKLNDPSVPAYVRSAFIQKVYGILVVQLIVTACIAFPFLYLDHDWVMGPGRILAQLCSWGSLLLMFGVICCCQRVVKTYPYNFIFLFSLTAMQGVIVGFITAQYQTKSIVLALGITIVMFTALSLFAICTKTDFTGCGPYLFCALVGLIIASFAITMYTIFFGENDMLRIILGCVGAILFSMYIVYDTQRIVGGTNREHVLEVDDYVMGALELYLDIINLFIYILAILGGRND